MYPNGELPETLIMLLAEDGEKKLEEYIKNILKMVSQAVSLADLEISLQYRLQKSSIARTKAKNTVIHIT